VFEQTDALFISECAEGSPCFMLLKIDGNNADIFANTTILLHSAVYRYNAVYRCVVSVVLSRVSAGGGIFL